MSVAAIAVLKQSVLLSGPGSYGDEVDSGQPDPESAWLTAKEESGLAGLLSDQAAAGDGSGASGKEYVRRDDDGQPLEHEMQGAVAQQLWKWMPEIPAVPLVQPEVDSAPWLDRLARGMSSPEHIGKTIPADQSNLFSTWFVNFSSVPSQNGLIATPHAPAENKWGDTGNETPITGRPVAPMSPPNPLVTQLTLFHGYAGTIREPSAGNHTMADARDAAFELRVTEPLARNGMDNGGDRLATSPPGGPVPIDSTGAAVAGFSAGKAEAYESASPGDIGQRAEVPGAESREEQGPQDDRPQEDHPCQEQQASFQERGKESRGSGLSHAEPPAAEPFAAQVGVFRSEVRVTEPDRPTAEAPNRAQPVLPVDEAESRAAIRAFHVEMTSPSIGKVKVRIFGTQNAMQIQVKSPDWEIRQSLQSGVKELVGRVEQLGLRVEDISGHNAGNLMTPGAGSPVTPMPEITTRPGGSRADSGHDGRHPDGSRPDWEEAIRRSQQSRRKK